MLARSRIETPVWRWFGGVSVALTLLGAVILLVRWGPDTARTGDLALVASVAINSVIVLAFGIYLKPRVEALFNSFEAGPDGPAAVLSIFSNKWLVPAGLVYAAVIALSAWRLNPWPEDAGSGTAFAMFLFAGNLVIGMGFGAIITFWYKYLSELPNIEFRILNLSRPAVVNLIRVNSMIVIATAIVVSIALVGVVLSSLEKDLVVSAFSVFTLLVLVCTYAVPIIPLSERLRALKAVELSRLEALIEEHVRGVAGAERDGVVPKPRADIGDILKARDLVKAVSTMPPNGEFSVSAAAVVAFLSFLPTIVDFAIKTFT